MTDPQEAPLGEARPSLRERNRLRTRRELLDAALKVFAEKGFAGSAVEAIAAEAGASKVTLYAYFPSGRDDLFRELYEEINTELLDRATAAHAHASGLVDRVVALARPLLEIGARPLVGPFIPTAIRPWSLHSRPSEAMRPGSMPSSSPRTSPTHAMPA